MIYVRRHRPDDGPQIRRLHDRVWVEWQGQAPDASPPDLDRLDECYLAFWVAIHPVEGAEEVVGMVGAHLPAADAPTGHTAGGSGLVQLSRLRVAPEFRREGVGAQLCRSLITWAADRGSEAILANTLAQNTESRALLRKLGFTAVDELVRSTELSWFELRIARQV